MQALPFADGSFDYVICEDVIEHLIFDPLFLVQQSHRVLKKGGILVLSTSPAVSNWFVILRHLFNLPVESGYDVRCCNPYARHNRLFGLKEVGAMVAGNGFFVIEAFNTSHPYRIDPLVSLRGRAFRRGLYVLDKLIAGLGRALPFLRESQHADLGTRQEGPGMPPDHLPADAEPAGRVRECSLKSIDRPAGSFPACSPYTMAVRS